MRIVHLRPTAMMLGALAITVGMAACGSSDASSTTAPAVSTVVTTQPAVTVPAVGNAPDTTTSTPATEATPATAATEPPTAIATETTAVSDAEVADLEKQLDEIDQLLAGIDADLSQD